MLAFLTNVTSVSQSCTCKNTHGCGTKTRNSCKWSQWQTAPGDSCSTYCEDAKLGFPPQVEAKVAVKSAKSEHVFFSNIVPWATGLTALAICQSPPRSLFLSALCCSKILRMSDSRGNDSSLILGNHSSVASWFLPEQRTCESKASTAAEDRCHPAYNMASRPASTTNRIYWICQQSLSKRPYSSITHLYSPALQMWK